MYFHALRITRWQALCTEPRYPHAPLLVPHTTITRFPLDRLLAHTIIVRSEHAKGDAQGAELRVADGHGRGREDNSLASGYLQTKRQGVCVCALGK